MPFVFFYKHVLTTACTDKRKSDCQCSLRPVCTSVPLIFNDMGGMTKTCERKGDVRHWHRLGGIDAMTTICARCSIVATKAAKTIDRLQGLHTCKLGTTLARVSSLTTWQIPRYFKDCTYCIMPPDKVKSAQTHQILNLGPIFIARDFIVFWLQNQQKTYHTNRESSIFCITVTECEIKIISSA